MSVYSTNLLHNKYKTMTTTNNNDQNKIVGIEALTQGGEFNFKPNFFPSTDFENF